MNTLIARLRKLAEPPTSLPTTEQAFRAAFQPFLRKLDGRLAQDNEDEVKELWERIHTLKNTPSATWAMAYSDAALDVYDAVLDIANALSLDDAKCESLAQKAQTDFAAWVSDHDKGPDATTVVAALSPRRKRLRDESVDLWKSLQAYALPLRSLGYRITSTPSGSVQLLFKDMDIRVTLRGSGSDAPYIAEASVRSPVMEELVRGSIYGQLPEDELYQAVALWMGDAESDKPSDTLEQCNTPEEVMILLEDFAETWTMVQQILDRTRYDMPEVSSEKS